MSERKGLVKATESGSFRPLSAPARKLYRSVSRKPATAASTGPDSISKTQSLRANTRDVMILYMNHRLVSCLYLIIF